MAFTLWWIALSYLAFPRMASTGDQETLPETYTSPAGAFDSLYSLGDAQLAINPTAQADPPVPLFVAQSAASFVGISERNPTTALVVNGNVRVTGCIWLGGVPKCDWCRPTGPSCVW